MHFRKKNHHHTYAMCKTALYYTLGLQCGLIQLVSQGNLSKVVTEFGSHLSKTTTLRVLAPNSDKVMQSTSVEQPPLSKGQLELAHSWLP